MITKSELIRNKQFDKQIIFVNSDAYILVIRYKSIHGSSFTINGFEYGTKKKGVAYNDSSKVKLYIRTLIKRYSGIH